MNPAPVIAVIGGGISGLAAAYRLRQAAPELKVVLIEKEQRLGGAIVTLRSDGYIIEGGPDSFLSYKPQGVKLSAELGLEDHLIGPEDNNRRTFVMRNGHLYRLPEGLSGLVPSRFWPMIETPLISPLGKLRMGLELFIPAKRDDQDETVASFATRRVGSEVYNRLVEPLLSGVFAGDGRELSLNAAFPQLGRTERKYGSLTRGMLAQKRVASRNGNGASSKSHRPAFLTFQNGQAELIEALAENLKGVQLMMGESVRTLLREEPARGYRLILESGKTLQADAVILATPAFTSADLLAGLDSDLAQLLRAIPYVSTATVSMAYRADDLPRPFEGHGYIVPRAENRPVLAFTWTSNKFAHRAPQGAVLIRAFIGRAGQEDSLSATDEGMVQSVRDELRSVLGVTATPVKQFIFRWPQALPQYVLGHLERLKTIEERLAHLPGLYLAGSAYRGVGIPDCIASGEAAAAEAIRVLRSEPEILQS
jgi:oxygen-dependent protoporphyrinogen oxidase